MKDVADYWVNTYYPDQPDCARAARYAIEQWLVAVDYAGQPEDVALAYWRERERERDRLILEASHVDGC